MSHPIPRQPPGGGTGDKPVRVFLIDDSTEVIKHLKEMLAPLPGVEVMGHAADVPEALRVILTSGPDVVILDLHLAVGSGIDVLKEINNRMLAIKVIVLTNYAFPQYKQRCIELGAYAFLDKSTDFTQVPQLIAGLFHAEGHARDSALPPGSQLPPVSGTKVS